MNDGATVGYCPCHPVDNPCQQDLCFLNICLISQQPCTTQADCITMTCELYEGEDYGGCVIGSGCGLIDGQHCPPP